MIRLGLGVGVTCCVLLASSPPTAAQGKAEPEIEAYCRTRAQAKGEKDRSPAEVACRTLMKGAIDAFAARLIPEAMEQLRLLDRAVVVEPDPPKHTPKAHGDLNDPFAPRKPRAKKAAPSSGGATLDPF